MKVEYLKYNQIDFAKWDNCVTNSFSGDISGYSWYLDVLYDEWDALVLDDYEVIMPLPVNKLFSFSYVKQSNLALKTGLFYQKSPQSNTIDIFFDSIPSKIKSIDIDIENFSPKEKTLKISEKHLYQLDLIPKYTEIYQKFSPAIKAALNSPDTLKISFQKGATVNNIIDFIIKTSSPGKNYIDKTRLFIATILRKKHGEIYTAYDSNNNMCAAAIFIGSHYKINMIELYSYKTDFGKKATIAIIDNYLKTNAEKPLTFVFPDTQNPALSSIYKEFGGSEKIISNIKISRFNYLFKILDKIKSKFSFIF